MVRNLAQYMCGHRCGVQEVSKSAGMGVLGDENAVVRPCALLFHSEKTPKRRGRKPYRMLVVHSFLLSFLYPPPP